MGSAPLITRITSHRLRYEVPGLGRAADGVGAAYDPAGRSSRDAVVLTVETDAGVTGEFVGYRQSNSRASVYAQIAEIAPRLIGRNALERESIWRDGRQAFGHLDATGLGPIDVALWDLAGKHYGAPVYELLGGSGRPLPAYASTLGGDRHPGGLNSPEAYGDFAVQSREMGYRGFKIHAWRGAEPDEVSALVLETRKRAGAAMDLLLDSGSRTATFAAGLKVGRACDEAGYMWLEDPFAYSGSSIQLHRKLRQMISTPILMGERLRGLEPHVDMIVADATDYVRVDISLDGGITGALKIAHAAQGFGLDAEIHCGYAPADRHLMSAITNTNYYELGLIHPKLPAGYGPPVFADDFSDGLDAIDGEGCVPVPRGPGLGVTLDWDYIEKHRVGEDVFE